MCLGRRRIVAFACRRLYNSYKLKISEEIFTQHARIRNGQRSGAAEWTNRSSIAESSISYHSLIRRREQLQAMEEGVTEAQTDRKTDENENILDCFNGDYVCHESLTNWKIYIVNDMTRHRDTGIEMYLLAEEHFAVNSSSVYTPHLKVAEDTISVEDGQLVCAGLTSPYQLQKTLSSSSSLSASSSIVDKRSCRIEPESESDEREENLETLTDSEHKQPSPQDQSVSKTELTRLLDAATVQKPANIKVTALWSYEPNHVTDLRVEKGERVTLLHRSGEWAFVESASHQQGFIPLCHCSLTRRRSSSLTNLSSELLRKIANNTTDALENDDVENHVETIKNAYNKSNLYRNAITPEPARRKIEARAKDFFTKKMPFSKGTYNARACESNANMRQKSDKGLLRSAAKKLRSVFKSSAAVHKQKQSKLRKENVNTSNNMYDWLDGFRNNNESYSSSTDSSDEDDEYIIRHRVRSYSNEYQRRSYHDEVFTDRTESSWNGYNTMPNQRIHRANGSTPRENQISGLTITSGRSDVSLTTGFATVRRLKTTSSSMAIDQNGVQSKAATLGRSLSFSHGERPVVKPRVKPVDLIEESDCSNDEALSDSPFHWGKTAEKEREDDNDEAVRRQLTRKSVVNKMSVTKDFSTADEKDLDVIAGQKVRVLNKSNKNWWLVESEDGNAGFVPPDILTPERVGTVYSQTQNAEKNSNCRSIDSCGEEQTASTVKLARISPTIRESNLSRDDGESVDEGISFDDVKRQLEAEIAEITRPKDHRYQLEATNELEPKTNVNGFELKTNLDGLQHEIHAGEVELKTNVNGLKFDATPGKFKQAESEYNKLGNVVTVEDYTQPCNIYIAEKRRENDSFTSGSSNLTNCKGGIPKNGMKLPSYEELMVQRSDTKKNVAITIDPGPSVVEQLLTVKQSSNNNISEDVGESSLIQTLLIQFKEEQEKLGNETLLSPRDLHASATTDSVSSACDSSSQTSYDSTDTIPRVLRRRSSLNKRVRFQNTPADNEASQKTESDKALATWM
eukprot:gene18043-19850_t